MLVLKRKNHPVIIGIGQSIHRQKITGDSVSVFDIAKMASDACVLDTGRPDILKFVDSLAVISIFSECLESPVARMCETIGIYPQIKEETAIGGNGPQGIINRIADRIMAGEQKVALLVGAEALYRESPATFDWPKLFERYKYEPVVGDKRVWANTHEFLHGLHGAPFIYPLFENALRADLKMNLSEYRDFLKTYFNNMEAIAAGNPYAWFNEGKKWDNVTDPTEGNPLFNFPYTKYMNPIPYVNQGAATIMTDTDMARKLEIPEEKWVYLHGGAEASEKWYVSERVNYYSSPMIRFTAETALEDAGLNLADIDFFDLYSCFPCATLISAREIGLPLNNLPPLSITGGLSFFGGPGNNYVMHSIAHAVERLRQHREEYGFITGVGHCLTKHSVGIYSGIEPEKPWQHRPQAEIQKRIDDLASPVFCEDPHGPATIETYTVLRNSPDGNPWTIIIARLDSGERCLATTQKGTSLAERMEQEEFIGYKGFVSSSENGPNIFR